MHRATCLVATTILTSCCVLVPTAFAQPTGQDILQGLGVSQEEANQLESGAILAYSDAEYESTDRELAADALIVLESGLDAVHEALKNATTIIPTKMVVDVALIRSEADFAGVGFGEEDFDEVKDLFKAKAGKKFNLSDAEISSLQAQLAPHRDASRAEKISAASGAVREILLGRYKEYRRAGLKGVVPYQRSRGKQRDVGGELLLTTEMFRPFADEFPEYFNLMENYPQGADCCENYFRWLKLDVRGRVVFALSHTMIQQTDEFILYTERQYFVSNTLNSVQVTLSWVPYGEDTVMGLAMSASVDILDSMMGRMLRSVGRNKAKDLVTDVMADVRDDLATGKVDDNTP